MISEGFMYAASCRVYCRSLWPEMRTISYFSDAFDASRCHFCAEHLWVKSSAKFNDEMRLLPREVLRYLLPCII